jgi:hypothetical protein
MKSLSQAVICVSTTFALLSYAQAAELRQIATISVPGEKLTSWDISFVDQASQRYFLADQSNRAVDIFDTKQNRFVGRVAGFIGAVIETALCRARHKQAYAERRTMPNTLVFPQHS